MGPPTSLGRGVHTSWAVCAAVGEGRDRTEHERPVVVLAPPLTGAPPPARHRGDGEPDAASTYSGLSAGSVRAGVSVSERLRVVAHQEIDARGAGRPGPGGPVGSRRRGAELGCRRHHGRPGALGLRPRQPRDLAFSLVVPADASASVTAEGYVVEYLLRAVIDRPRRPDTM